ncbi:MAG TPA: anti-sigma factor [Burkholderiaceae bacterium]|nr:anti-sigma factor [Burkholderiaceae bacterium]
MSSKPPAPFQEEDLHAYVDNALDATRRKEVQDYLDHNPEVAQKATALAAQRQILRSAFTSVADEPIPDRLSLAGLLGEGGQRHRWPWQMAAAVLLSFGLGIYGGLSMHNEPRPAGGVAALAGEARVSYSTYANDADHAVEMGPDQKAELVSWVSRKLKRSISVPDLTKSGYRFTGGRVVATDHGPAGMFVYEGSDGSRLAVMMRPMAREQDTPMMHHSDGSVGGYAWAARGLGYSLVGTERAEVLHPLADEVRRQARPDLNS